MGSHVSTVIANIYMEKFEEQADGGNRNVAINIKSDCHETNEQSSSPYKLGV